MRILEFASAEEQLALWKLVSDNVWGAIRQQAKAEAEQKALKKAQAKKVPKRKGMGVPSPNVPSPPKMAASPPISARKPIAKPINPTSQQQAQSVGVAKSIQPKAPADTQQLTNLQQAIGNQQTANKARKTGILAK